MLILSEKGLVGYCISEFCHLHFMRKDVVLCWLKMSLFSNILSAKCHCTMCSGSLKNQQKQKKNFDFKKSVTEILMIKKNNRKHINNWSFKPQLKIPTKKLIPYQENRSGE